MRKTIAACLAGVSVALGSCGTSLTADFATQVVGVDGKPLLLDDLAQIANDASLSVEEKRQAFRDLGVEDEKLIDALLDL